MRQDRTAWSADEYNDADEAVESAATLRELSLIRSAIEAFIICILGVIWLAAFLFVATGVAEAQEAVREGRHTVSGSAAIFGHVIAAAAVLIGGSVTVYMLRDMAGKIAGAPVRRGRPKSRLRR